MSNPTPKKSAAKPSRPSSSGRTTAAPEAEGPGPGEGSLPGPEEIARMLAPVRAFMDGSGLSRIRGFLDRLSASPPQVLLLEGGTADERLAAAQYWALLLNCEPEERKAPAAPAASGSLPELPGLPGLLIPPARAKDEAGSGIVPPTGADAGQSVAPSGLARKRAKRRPCLECPTCVRMVAHLHRDCFFFDGLAGSIKIDDVRAMRAVLGEPPREARHRVVLFREAQALVEAAANALLKAFEEPRPGTSFLLLVPQRERLLPTLVSRSMVLTLPWPGEEDSAAREALAPMEAALCTFLRSGRDLFERSGIKGTVDAPLVHALGGVCRRALSACIKARKGGPPLEEELEKILARLSEERMRMLDEALAECQDSLVYGVNPVLALEWLATRMYFFLPRR